MSAAEKPQKFMIGFHAGQTLTGRAQPAELARLRQALGGSGYYDLRAEDGTVALELSSVAYLLVDVEEHRVGFGS
jgi:hypothetical protein